MKKITLLLITLILLSCGARQKQKTVSSEKELTEKTTDENTQKQSETKTNSESNIKKSEVVTVDDKNETIIEVETFEPIDPTKPSSINGQVFVNSRKIKTKITQKNNTKESSQRQEDGNGKVNSQRNTKELSVKKVIEKANGEKYNSINNVKRDQWSLWWLLIPIGIICIIWWIWKNYKEKIWFV